MKIAIFMSNSPTSGWNMGLGLCATLKRMGHQPTGVMLPTSHEASEQVIRKVKASVPTIEELNAMDAIVVSGPEHIAPWMMLCYGRQPWKELNVPKAAWLHESCSRDDYDIDFDSIKWTGDEFFFPAIQDADFHDQEMFAPGRSHFLAFGVDTGIFKPRPGEQSFDVGFLGLLYPKRQAFLTALSRHQHPPIAVGMCAIQDLRGYDWEGSMRLLAENTRDCKVFFNLPSMSRLLVMKIYETLACGTFCLTPNLGEIRGAERNMPTFESGKHLVYYSPSNLPLVAQLLREWSSPEKDSERARIAEAGCREVHEKHSLDRKMEAILMTLRVGARAHA